ncbi:MULTISPECIES: MazG nucleotide pyrophosphohydrolase domain-containing protein [Dietzia]|uniref:MazG nucleotide pyrophosphohydrolase domain-containing protein n=1 Tax=Dietzia TaxID=37914 RepID=UPI0020C4169A|nr:MULTISPECIES: MazG nucleotide pyrophosphohydrolase domain-containing protein [Dietzia]MCT1712164.1 nucleoside triphosphate hydrolase [Dietzia cinnamea]MCT2273495.1 nucleoside triphosphate hydrolase [Dietzia cinnamea]
MSERGPAADAPRPHREDSSARDHSADAGETVFSTAVGAGAGRCADSSGDRLAEAVAVMARIRRDGRWESAQTHASLLPYLIEESWELVDAVADGDRDELVSELGDLLLQVLFHAAIGAERGDAPFDIQDVAGALLDKLRRRAPYWFDNDDDDDNAAARVPSAAALDADEQDRLWQQAKAAERAGRPPRGVVEGISWDMPALALGQKVLSRARSAGIPDDLVPAEMRVVHIDATGLFRDAPSDAGGANTDAADAADARDSAAGASGSAEVEYRQAVRRFAATVRAAESRLPVPAVDATDADWRAAWPV